MTQRATGKLPEPSPHTIGVFFPPPLPPPSHHSFENASPMIDSLQGPSLPERPEMYFSPPPTHHEFPIIALAVTFTTAAEYFEKPVSRSNQPIVKEEEIEPVIMTVGLHPSTLILPHYMLQVRKNDNDQCLGTPTCNNRSTHHTKRPRTDGQTAPSLTESLFHL